MLKVIFGTFLAVAGPLVLDRWMTSAPEWVWRLVALLCVLVGVAFVILSDVIWPYVAGNQATRVTSTVLVGLAAAVVVGSGWYLFIYEVVSSPSVKASDEAVTHPPANPIRIDPLPSRDKPPFPITYEVITTREIRNINMVVVIEHVEDDNSNVQANNVISPRFFAERLLPGQVLVKTTENPFSLGTENSVRVAIVTVSLDFHIPGLTGTWLAKQRFRLDHERRPGNEPPVRLRWEPISPVEFAQSKAVTGRVSRK